jgi:hypothetical protein
LNSGALRGTASPQNEYGGYWLAEVGVDYLLTDIFLLVQNTNMSVRSQRLRKNTMVIKPLYMFNNILSL